MVCCGYEITDCFCVGVRDSVGGVTHYNTASYVIILLFSSN